jgi:hypothetical protein
MSRSRISLNIALTLKPAVPHPGFGCPPVISFNPRYPVLYNTGFKNPNGDFPFAMRTSFKSATTAANVGVEALVPPIAYP